MIKMPIRDIEQLVILIAVFTIPTLGLLALGLVLEIAYKAGWIF